MCVGSLLTWQPLVSSAIEVHAVIAECSTLKIPPEGPLLQRYVPGIAYETEDGLLPV